MYFVAASHHLTLLPDIAFNKMFIAQEIKWPGGEERSSHGAFFEEWGHPEFRKVVYIADGTKSMMRNPSKVRE